MIGTIVVADGVWLIAVKIDISMDRSLFIIVNMVHAVVLPLLLNNHTYTIAQHLL